MKFLKVHAGLIVPIHGIASILEVHVGGYVLQDVDRPQVVKECDYAQEEAAGLVVLQEVSQLHVMDHGHARVW